MTRYDNIPKNTDFLVTEAPSCGTFEVGDRIRFQNDGTILLCNNGGGWIEAADAIDIEPFKIELDAQKSKDIISSLKAKLEVEQFVLDTFKATMTI